MIKPSLIVIRDQAERSPSESLRQDLFQTVFAFTLSFEFLVLREHLLLLFILERVETTTNLSCIIQNDFIITTTIES